MIPIRDTQPSNCFPVVTYILIGINLLVFMLQMKIGFGNEVFFYSYGLVPAKYTVHEVSRHFSLGNQLFSIFSYMFLHGGFLHFIGNMWILYIFGDNVEDHFGSLRFLGFYLICGILSGLSHFLLNPMSLAPTIGASGAISGVLGAYMLLYPQARVLVLIPVFFFIQVVRVPALLVLGIWFLMQIVSSLLSGDQEGGVAFSAHLGGFVTGMVLIPFFKHSNIRLYLPFVHFQPFRRWLDK